MAVEELRQPPNQTRSEVQWTSRGQSASDLRWKERSGCTGWTDGGGPNAPARPTESDGETQNPSPAAQMLSQTRAFPSQEVSLKLLCGKCLPQTNYNSLFLI